MYQTNKKILLLGHARHGKDTTAEIISRLFFISFMSSSQLAADIFIFESLKDKYGYKTSEECFDDRSNHRAEWYDLICNYNKNDRARLAKEIMNRSDMYVGMRDDREIKECLYQSVFDIVIGVYDYRKPEEGKDSFNINLFEVSHLVITNSGSIKQLEEKIILIKPLLIHTHAPHTHINQKQ